METADELTSLEALQALVVKGKTDWKRFGEVRIDHWNDLNSRPFDRSLTNLHNYFLIPR